MMPLPGDQPGEVGVPTTQTCVRELALSRRINVMQMLPLLHAQQHAMCVNTRAQTLTCTGAAARTRAIQCIKVCGMNWDIRWLVLQMVPQSTTLEQ